MKTIIEYVERETGKLKGTKGVVFEDSPDTVYLIGLEGYAMDIIDGKEYAPFFRKSDRYKTLNEPKPDIKVGDKVRYKGSNEIETVKQLTLGSVNHSLWYIVTDECGLRVPVGTFVKIDTVEKVDKAKIYTVYYRHVNDTNVTGVEMNAQSIQHAIEELFEWVKEMDHLDPQYIDVCHVEVSNA